MRIVITGGMGFIGITLARRLVADGHDVALLDNLTVQIHGELPWVDVPEGVTIHRMDVRQLTDHPEILEGVDAVFHLAAETGTAQSMYRIAEYVSVNELGTATLLQAIAKCTVKPRQVILASSRSVYGEGAYVSESNPEHILQPAPRTKEQMLKGIWEPTDNRGANLKAVATPESLAFAPGSVYAATKASQELLLNSAALALGFRSTIFRFQNVYGEGQSLQNPYTGIISIFFNRARQGRDIPIYEDGLESRDFIHISDIVDGLVASLEADLPPGAVMNLGAGEPTSVKDLASALLNAAGLDVATRVTGQFRVGDIRHCYADLARARALIGFQPKISLAAGLKRFCDWAAGQPIHVDKLDSATEELRKKGLTN
ncbi:NAD-dependent epimerase/dehydratase family protein [Herbaspirillum chlorophenolicum]|uniref:NAD-dependent epimerase/dehydratase family protein n=1 Tax=Herbaspirillum chlorophenolicum TaxID=211589 RepID=UPI0009E1BCA8|nr:NAD-dependent epimerase/dehydratase family protein [Herbaspirillum chlorophenolicum]